MNRKVALLTLMCGAVLYLLWYVVASPLNRLLRSAGPVGMTIAFWAMSYVPIVLISAAAAVALARWHGLMGARRVQAVVASSMSGPGAVFVTTWLIGRVVQAGPFVAFVTSALGKVTMTALYTVEVVAVTWFVVRWWSKRATEHA
jgi:hypothetical protein